MQQNPLVRRVIDILDTDRNGEVDFQGEEVEEGGREGGREGEQGGRAGTGTGGREGGEKQEQEEEGREGESMRRRWSVREEGKRESLEWPYNYYFG